MSDDRNAMLPEEWLRRRVSELESQLTTATARAADLTEKLARVERERDDAREILRHTNEGLTEIEQQRDAARARVAELEAELARVEGQAAAMREALGAAIVPLEAISIAMDDLLYQETRAAVSEAREKTLAALSSTAGSSYVPRAELDAARAEVSRLTRERDALEGRVTALEAGLRSIRGRLSGRWSGDGDRPPSPPAYALLLLTDMDALLAPPAPGDKDGNP